METSLTLLHVLICLLLVVVVLLQPGKSGMGALGGGSSGGNFGAKSPTTVLSKFTVYMAVGFMLSSLTLAWLSVRDHTVQIDLGEDTHFPAEGFALPGDLSITPDAEADEGQAPDMVDSEPLADEFSGELDHEGAVDAPAVFEESADDPDEE